MLEKFNYKAKTKNGRVVTGIVEAVSQTDAVRLLQDKKLVVFSLHPRTGRSFGAVLSSLRGVSDRDATELTRQLATMIGAGLTLVNSLSILQEQAKPAVAKLLAEVARKVQGGASFYESLRQHPKVFSRVYLSLVRSGEMAGKLDKVLLEMADSLEKDQAFRRKIKGAMVYPSIVLIGMVAVAFIMMIYVVPKLTEMYQEVQADLPLPTQILVGVSNFVSRFWALIILATIGLVFGIKHWRNTPSGRDKFDHFILRVPVVNKLLTKIILTQITRTFSMLISAGVPIIESLNIVAEAANNVVYETSVKEAAYAVEKGMTLSNALEKFEEYPPLVIQMISVGEQTGKVGEVLARVANYFEQEAEEAIKGLTTAIEPLMMIILGIGVGFIVISIITPIYNLTSQF